MDQSTVVYLSVIANLNLFYVYTENEVLTSLIASIGYGCRTKGCVSLSSSEA